MDSLSTVSGYEAKNTTAYHNVHRCMPFYDSADIAAYGNQLPEDSKLHNTELRAISPLDTNGKPVSYLTIEEPERIKKLKLVFTDDTTLIPIPANYGRVPVDAKTGQVIKQSVPAKNGVLVHLDGSADLVFEDREK